MRAAHFPVAAEKLTTDASRSLVEGFAVLAYFGHAATPVAFLPVAVQFVGRWGLYRFVTKKFNIVPGSPYYDAFEDRKQPLELAAVLGGVAVACLA